MRSRARRSSAAQVSSSIWMRFPGMCAPASGFAVVVIEGLGGPSEDAEGAGARLAGLGRHRIGADLVAVGVLRDLRQDLGGDREIAQLGVRGIDELVRALGPARRADDHVAGAHGVALLAEAQRALAREDH